MFPSYTTKTFVSTSLLPGPKPEEDVSNKAYLASFLEYSCWLRPVIARQHLRILEDKNSRQVERLAALAAFYQVAGQVVEDAMTTFIAWSLWAKDRDKISLPNLFEKLSLRFSRAPKPVGPNYINEISEKLSTGKRIEVYPREYLVELLKVEETEIPILLGIKWKKYPSNKLVPKEHRDYWDNMGYLIKESIRPLTDEKGQLLTTCYNKIKHGPQLIIASGKEASRKRGYPENKLDVWSDAPTLRLLHMGARVQETLEELEEGKRTAPFIVDDIDNLRRWFFQQIVHTSNVLYGIGTWIYNTNFIDDKRSFSVKRPEVEEIILEQVRHHQSTFGETRPFGKTRL